MASTNKHKTFDRFTYMTKIASKLVGLWPLDDESIFSVKFVLILLTLQSMWLSSVAYAYSAERDENFFESVSHSIVMSITIAKFLSVRLKYKTLKIIILKMEHCWTKYERFSTTNRTLMSYYMMKGKKACMVCIFFVGFSTIVHYSSKLMQSLQASSSAGSCLSLPYPAVYPFAIPCSKSDPIFFGVLYVWQSFTVVCLAAVFIGIDCLLIGSASHASGQLAAIGQSLRRLRPGKERLHAAVLLDVSSDGKFAGLKSCLCLGCIVEWHARVLRYCKLIDETYNLLLLTEFMGSTFQFCFHSYATILHSSHKDFIGVSSFFIYLILFNFRFYMYCNMCDTIADLGENIKGSVYETEWYKFRSESIRSIMLCMLRANSPIKITAGKFFQLDRISYKNVVMTTASYVSVLLSLK